MDYEYWPATVDDEISGPEPGTAVEIRDVDGGAPDQVYIVHADTHQAIGFRSRESIRPGR